MYRKKISVLILSVLSYVAFFAVILVMIGNSNGEVIYQAVNPVLVNDTPSRLVSTVVSTGSDCCLAGFIALTVLLITSIKNKNIDYSLKSAKYTMICYVLALISNTAFLVYLFVVNHKYCNVIYDGLNPVTGSSGETVKLLNTLTVPMVLSAVGIVLFILGLISAKNKAQ